MAYSPSPNTTVSAPLAHLATVWYNRRALDQLKRRFRFYNACEPDMVPRRSGKTVQWFRYVLLGANTTPAPEGTVTNSNTLSTVTLSGTVSEYQDFITVSTLLDETAIDPIVQNAAEQLAIRRASRLTPSSKQPLTGSRARSFLPQLWGRLRP